MTLFLIFILYNSMIIVILMKYDIKYYWALEIYDMIHMIINKMSFFSTDKNGEIIQFYLKAD